MAMPSGSQQRVRRENAVQIAIITVVAAIIVTAAVFIAVSSRSVVAASLTVEAGSPLPPASDFLKDNSKTAEYGGPSPAEIDTEKPGNYPVSIMVGEKRYDSELVISDTVPPSATPAGAVVWVNAAVSEQDFVKDISDATTVKLSFDKKPDTSAPGIFNITVVLTDEGKNKTEITSELRVYELKDKLEVPLNSDKNTVNASRFVNNVTDNDKALFTLEADLTAIDFAVPGEYGVSVKLNGEAKTSRLCLVDVTPPTADPVAVSKYLEEEIEPEEFVENISDESAVTLSFLAVPDNMLEGEQTVTVVLTDAFGNTAQVQSTLVIIKDETLPVIKGELDKMVFVGDTVTYRTGVTATDSRGKNLTLDIDSSGVDTKTPGAYTVKYSATDNAGRTVTVKGSVTVYDATREQVDAMADAVLADILKEGMSKTEQARAIYDWVQKQMYYVNGSFKGTIENGAYRAMKYGKGDCFTYYAVSEVLLTRAGIDNIGVKRIPGTPATHYWSLVNVGDGWYHFDTTPHKMGGSGFMITESQALALAKQRSNHYYDFDKTLHDYPEVVQ